MNRETAAGVRFAGVCGGKQGIKVETRRDRRKSSFVPAGRLPVKPPIELRDETREDGVGLYHRGNPVQGEPNRQTAL